MSCEKSFESQESLNESNEGSGISHLSIIEGLNTPSLYKPWSISDLDDICDIPKSQKIECLENTPNVLNEGKKGEINNETKREKLNKDLEMENKDNFQSSSKMKKDLPRSPFKSPKKRSSFRLGGLTIQILKDAKHLFHKKRNQNCSTDVYENTPLKKQNLNDSYQTPINTFKNFFPHVIATTISSNLNHMLPSSVNSISTSFQSISPTYSPTSSSISKSQKHKNKQGKFGAKTNIENGGKSDKILMIENGNLYNEVETCAKMSVCQFNKDFFINNIRKDEKRLIKCSCHLKKENSKCFRKRKYLYPLSSAPEGRRRCRKSSSSDSEKYFKIPEATMKRQSNEKIPDNTKRRIYRTFNKRCRNVPSSSSSPYESTTDEEGNVDTSKTSEGSLTSNLSLFTSAEGDDDAMGVNPSYLDLRTFRHILCNNAAVKERKLDICNNISPSITDASHHLFNWKDKYSLQNNLRAPKIISITPTTNTRTTTTVTSSAIKSSVTTTATITKTALKAGTKTTSPKGNINSKFRVQLPRGEMNYVEKRTLATRSKNDASEGISTMINTDFEVLEGLPPHVYLRGYNSLFPLHLMSEIPFNKSRFPSQEPYIRNGKKSKTPASTFNYVKSDFDISSKLDFDSREKELFESSITPSQLSHLRAESISNAKLDNLTQQYEERITELHSVIAELTRKLDRQNEDVILEEEEEDEEEDIEEQKDSRRSRNSKKGKDGEGLSLSELSSQEQNETTECSTSDAGESEAMYNREEANDVQPPHSTDVSTSCEIDDRAVEAGQCIADLDVSGCHPINNSNHSNIQPRNDNGTDDIIGDDVMCQGSSSVGFEEEIKMLREENTGLQQALALSHHKASNQRSVIMALSREREIFKRKVRELEKMQPAIPLSFPHISDAIMVKGLRGSPLTGALTPMSSSVDVSVNNNSRAISPSANSQHQEVESSTNDGVKVICKLAERVRLKKAESGDFRVTGSDLSSVGVSTTGVAEQLAASLQEESDAQELFHVLATAGGVFAPHERLKEYELEAERLHARIDHLRAQNDVLSATLSESKACCDRLALKTGRAEAQSGALKMGVEVLDQILETFEVLTALHEAQIGLLVVTCQVTGVDLGSELGFECVFQDADPLIRIKRAQEQRRTAENVARHLISRFEDTGSKFYNTPVETNGIHSLSSSTSSFSSEGAHQEEHMLRETISRLQTERARILACFKSGGDSSPMEDYFPPKTPLNEDEAHKLDLENAVLMQELTAIREDRAELRAQVYLLEREKTGLELRIGTCEAQAAGFCATIDHLKSQLSQAKSTSNSHESVGDSGLDTASSEAESLRRENQLKNRIDDLVSTLEKVTKNSEARHRQSQEFINDLKKANSALLTAVDRLKKKYTLRVKRMEQQTLALITKHEEQGRVLKNRIACLEEQLRCDVIHPSHQVPASSASDSTTTY